MSETERLQQIVSILQTMLVVHSIIEAAETLLRLEGTIEDSPSRASDEGVALPGALPPLDGDAAQHGRPPEGMSLRSAGLEDSKESERRSVGQILAVGRGESPHGATGESGVSVTDAGANDGTIERELLS